VRMEPRDGVLVELPVSASYGSVTGREIVQITPMRRTVTATVRPTRARESCSSLIFCLFEELKFFQYKTCLFF